MSQGVTVVENMDDGEELQITDVSGWAWPAHHRDSQDGNCGALHALPLELGWGHPEQPGSGPDSPPRGSPGLQLALLSRPSQQADLN